MPRVTIDSQAAEAGYPHYGAWNSVGGSWPRQLLKIEVCDHVIMGSGKHVSLRSLGYFAVF
jgi:hypothetical protein